MTIKVECPQCDKAFRLPDESAGKKFRCKACSAVIAVPSAEEEVDVTDDVIDDDPPVRRKASGAKPKRRKPKPAAAGTSPLLWIAAGGGALVLVLCVVIVLNIGRRAPSVASTGPVDSPLPVATVATPTFPDLGTPRVLQPSGARMWFIKMPPAAGPGQSMAMRVYLPPTDAPHQSLPCVLVAPAGTNLLVGNDMDADDYHAETLPYVEAGMAVIFYSLDGGIDMQQATDAQFAAAYQKFRAAQAGVVNGRNALEFALAKLPQVDPRRVYTAGHSSAGTVSLLMAAHEPRLAGAIAYAPCSDVEARLAEAAANRDMRQLLTDLPNFLKQSSPKTHTARVGCPVFLFHASDDSNVMVTESQAYAQQLKAAGKSVEFQTVPTGDHYDSMISQGIPQAIAWLVAKHAATPGQQ